MKMISVVFRGTRSGPIFSVILLLYLIRNSPGPSTIPWLIGPVFLSAQIAGQQKSANNDGSGESANAPGLRPLYPAAAASSGFRSHRRGARSGREVSGFA